MMEIKGFNEDMAKMFALASLREEQIAAAPESPDLADPVNALSRRLYPDRLRMMVKRVVDETADTRTFCFGPAPGTGGLPPFRAGQYLSLKVAVEGTPVTRPYSLSSAPAEARSGFELTIRRQAGGFVTEHIWRQWRAGTVVEATGPHGNFYHEPLRDSRSVVTLAGGSGITPFRSMIREIASGHSDLNLTLLYGSRSSEQIIFRDELTALAAEYPDKLKVIYVLSDPESGWRGRTGLLDAALIRETAGDLESKSFFVCGPPAMYRFVKRQLQELAIEWRRVRFELAGSPEDITLEPGYPAAAAAGKIFQVTVRSGSRSHSLSAAAEESILSALERAGLAPDSRCRSGECGFCRALLVSGDTFVRPEGDGRRAADRVLGFLHPCSAYPLSDLVLQVP
jgi:glycine betaine catabolism B